ncbi:MAG TPA: CaiB/BaiF CoA-transferase family protein [Acidimicrobiales bacterium]|nr:CaiB/BaiF CoA-transferase family protein [Acidimicrobiales bacterium]
MPVDEVANDEGVAGPLDGVRVLALEQMQALPFATQLLARLGAEVIKVENPAGGDMGRSSLPAVPGPDGRPMGATFLRNNLAKRSVAIDLKHPRGRELVLELAGHVDVVAENFRSGTLDRLGLGWEDVAARHPSIVYLSVSGFGTGPSPYDGWPAFASTVEAMSGIYEWSRRGDDPPVVAPVGALGDIGTALFATVGLLAALRHRDRTGEGQHVDVAMYDALVSLTDIVANFWSMGVTERRDPLIVDGFRASDGWFVVQVGRRHQFERLCEVIGRPGWLEDPRLADPPSWREHLEDVIRPGIESWAASRTKHEAAAELAAAGVAAGPCNDGGDLLADPHLAARNMLVEIPRPDGGRPVLVPGNPIKLSAVPEAPAGPPPVLGADTEAVLTELLGLDRAAVEELAAAGVVATA